MQTLDLPQEPRDEADRYIRFLGDSPTPYHAVVQAENRLRSAGFERRSLSEPLRADPGDRIYVVHPDGKTLIAAHIGSRSPVQTGYAIFAAHTDSPDLQLRLNPLETEAGCVLLETQTHGGLIRRSWLDRPLALAGCVFQLVRDKEGKPRFSPMTGLPLVTRTLLRVDRPIATIPELAIHLDRGKNDGMKINPQTQLNAIFATGIDEDAAMKALSVAAGMPLDQIDGFDLHLIPWQPPTRVGIDESLIVGGRHDDLAMVYAGLAGLIRAAQASPAPQNTRVAAFFDAEETGSQTSSGAASLFLRDLLLRIARRHPETGETVGDAEQALTSSFVVSGDMAHALHPAFMDKHDKQHAPLINQGLVVKVNTNDRYATTGETAAAFQAMCEVADVPMQVYINRQDVPCGSTIGPITAARLGARTVDIGAAMWGMHSSVETMGAHDVEHSVAVLHAFFQGGSTL